MRFEEQISEMHGAFSAIFTPFDEQGAVNFDMLTRIAEFQLASGLKGFFVTGSTGEGLLLSYDERLSVIRHMVQKMGDRATIIAHVGHPSTDYACRLARDSAEAGVNWIASVAPIFHGTTFDGALRHYAKISAATSLPFMVYSLGGIIDPRRDATFFQLPNVCGLKYTGADYFSVQQLQRFVDQPIAVMTGFDEQFLASLTFDFSGGIGSTYNFAPQIYADIYRYFHDGRIAEAMQLQARINQVTETMIQYENWSFRKAIMKYVGFDCGAYRSPYAPLTSDQYAELEQQLDALGVLKKNS